MVGLDDPDGPAVRAEIGPLVGGAFTVLHYNFITFHFGNLREELQNTTYMENIFVGEIVGFETEDSTGTSEWPLLLSHGRLFLCLLLDIYYYIHIHIHITPPQALRRICDARAQEYE